MVLKKGKSDVTFVFQPQDHSCQHVELAGSFNEWQPNLGKMVRQKDGSFRKRVHLDPGEYRYKFLVDGKWVTDPEAERLAPNPYGTMDSLLIL